MSSGPGSDDPAPERSSSPEAWRTAARRLFSPVERFLAVEAASGILLLVAAALALIAANSPLRAAYQALWHTSVGGRLGGFALERDLHFLVNDGLMVIFFFVVGLEIKRELVTGELSEPKRAALPAIAALGGMLAPAAIYLGLNLDPSTARGWGVPVATDIAFALGVLSLLGRRVPPALRVLLLALAVIDDLGAIVVIALFYTAGIQPWGLAIAGAGLLLVLSLRKLGVRSPLAYVPAGVVLWAGVLATGVHPTIAGVALGLLTPAKAWADEAASPLERIEQALHGWVAFVIMPVFALANAGVALGAADLAGPGRGVFVGVLLGLVLGKPIGVLALSWLAVRLRLAALPAGIGWRAIAVLGLVAGIGFTMALFIAGLAFPSGPFAEVAKLGILCASAVAAVLGLAAGRLLLQVK